MSRPTIMTRQEIERKRIEAERYRGYLNGYVHELEGLLNNAAGFYKDRVKKLISDAQSTSRKLSNTAEFNLAPGYVNVVINNLDRCAKNLKNALERENNTLRSLKAVRDEDIPMVNRDTLNYIQSVSNRKFLSSNVSSSDSNVIGSPRGRATNEIVEAIKSFDGEPVYKKPNYTTRTALKLASRSAIANVNEAVADIENLLNLGKARVLNDEERKIYDVKTSNSGAEAFVWSRIDSLVQGVGKYSRYLTGDSVETDSSKYKKYLKNRDKALMKLVRELGVGGIASDIMRILESQLSQDGYLDSQSFNNILAMLGKQVDADKQGQWADIMDEVNGLNDAVIQKAKDHVENEDSMSMVRLFQVVLVASLLFGFPFIGPIVGELSATIFGHGLAQGAPQLMTSDKLWIIGDVADKIMLDDLASILLTKTPILSDLIGVMDYVLLSNPGTILGNSVINFSSFPLIPVGAAVYASFYKHSFEDYNKTKDSVRNSFKEFDRKLDKIVEKYTSGPKADHYKNAGGDLVDNSKREEFCKEKYSLIKGANKIAAITDFISYVNDMHQTDDLSDYADHIFKNIFSQDLMGFLYNNGLQGKYDVSDFGALKEAVAKLIYESDSDQHKKNLAEELYEKFGSFVFACETSSSDDRGEIIEKFNDYYNDKGSQKGVSQMGNSIFDARYNLLRAHATNVKYNEGLLTGGIAGKDDSEIRDFVAQLSNESQRVEREIIGKESKFIEEAIKKRSLDNTELHDYHRDISKDTLRPKSSPGNVEVSRVNDSLNNSRLADI